MFSLLSLSKSVLPAVLHTIFISVVSNILFVFDVSDLVSAVYKYNTILVYYHRFDGRLVDSEFGLDSDIFVSKECVVLGAYS